MHFIQDYDTRHVVVFNGKVKEPIYEIFSKVLISLGKIFTGDNFTYDSLFKLNKQIDLIRKNLLSHKIFIDSGGYSIIVGDIPKYSIPKLINLYAFYLENFYEKFDYIFSLDIPLSISLDINYQDVIYNYNSTVQEKITKLLIKHSEIKNKLYFVWQFKTKKLFQIWNEIFYEQKLYNYYSIYSVGGLVGLKRFANINFSGYIGPILYVTRIYKQHYDKIPKYVPFHILGQYATVDQLTILILEKYLKEKYKINYYFTYDSAAIHSAFMEIKDNFYILHNNKACLINELSDIINNEDIELITKYKNEIEILVKELINRTRFSNSEIAKFAYALGVVTKEKFFNEISSLFAELLLTIKHHKHIPDKVKLVISKIKNEQNNLDKIFTNRFISVLTNNLKIIHFLDNKYDIDAGEKLMYKFIDLIGLQEIIQ